MAKKENILIIITASIAAYKTLDIIRKLKEQNCDVTIVLTKAAKEFVTKMSCAVLSQNKVYDDMFDVDEELQMGHINLSRNADKILVAPATAQIIASFANGFADDLASTILLASDKPIYMAPAMNVKMWENKAVIRNIKTLKQDGINIIEPEFGKMACNEVGYGRMANEDKIIKSILK